MKVIYPVPPALWDEICEAAPNATFFHSRLWSQIVLAGYPELTDASRVFVMDDGTRALLPMMAKSELKGLFRSYDSLPAGTYGGVIATGEVSQAAVDEMYQSVMHGRVSGIKVTSGPFPTTGLPSRGAFEEMYTPALDLTPGFEAVQTGFSRGNKSSINKARRSGLTVEVGGSEQDYHDYYSAYEETVQRWGDRVLSHHPFKMFQAIRTLAAECTKLWLVKREGELLGGILNFYYRDCAYYWNGAWRASAAEYRPSNLVQAEAIKDACDSGYRWYDFAPSGPNEGVAQFKRSFGPCELPVHRAYVESPLWQTWMKTRSRILRKK